MKDEYEAEIENKDQQIKIMIDALLFYKNISNLNRPAYIRQGVLVRNLKQAAYIDGGKIASDALKKIQELNENRS